MRTITAAIIALCGLSLMFAPAQSQAGPIPNQGASANEFIPMASGLNNPRSVIVVGTKMIVADTLHHRILIWNDSSFFLNTPPDLVIGQTNLNSTTCGTGGAVCSPSSTTLNSPSAVASDGTRLFIADTGFHRVLIYNTIPTTNGAAANVVVGQSSFYSFGASRGERNLKNPAGVWVSGSKLFVADTGNHRVLIWGSTPTENYAPADVVVGQPDFYTVSPGVSATKLNTPKGIWAGDRLVVADYANHRVLIWNTIPTSNSANADLVIGQTDFTSNVAGTSQRRLFLPSGVFVENHFARFWPGTFPIEAHNRLYVVDGGNHRVLVFNPLPTAGFPAAKWVIGQNDFTTGVPGTDRDRLNSPNAVITFQQSSQFSLAIADSSNNRIVNSPVPSAPPAQPVLSGPTWVSTNAWYAVTSADTDGDDLRYRFQWDRCCATDIGWFRSGASTGASSWGWGAPDVHALTVWVSDAYGQTSLPSVLQVKVAGYETTPNIIADRSDAYGNYKIRWNPIAGADKYELLESADSSFTLPTSHLLTTNFKLFTKTSDGTWYYKVRAWQGDEFSDWSGPYSQQVRLGVNTLFTLGIKDNSDAEFAQRDFTPDCYPGLHTANQCAKEVNLTWFNALYLHFPLTQFEANQGVLLHLDPAWNDGTGALRVAVEVWTGKDWQEAGGTLMNMTEAGYVDVPPSFLKVGMNDLRLRAVSGTGGTTVVTWDQIKIQLAPFSPDWRLGDNDSSDAEFSQTNFALVFNADTDPVSRFPKEINTGWYPHQYIHFSLSGEQAQKAAVLSLDVFWSNGAGVLTVAAERWDRSNWVVMGTATINSARPGKIVIPAYHLQEGLNQWRLTAVLGTDGTTVAVWESISLDQRRTLPEAVTGLLEEILDTTLNYFLHSKAMTESGLPLTALKVTDRARFGYSNPTEWGYTLQAWLIAAERGLLSAPQLRSMIDRALTTMERLQADPQQFKFGMFYPFYIVADSAGNDIPLPYHDSFHELPSGDCALLWGSLNVVEGWLLEQGYTAEAGKANSVKSKLNFRPAYFAENGRRYISMTVNADTAQRNPFTWLYWADEGGVVNMICYLSGSNTWEEFQSIFNTQERPTRSWNGHTTRESAYFNAMFTWGQRSFLGFPMLGDAKERAYGIYSFIPNVTAHLDYGDWLGIDYPGFSDAMTQTFQKVPLVGRFTPPNLKDVVANDLLLPSHITPHALAIPFCALDALDESVLRRLFEKWVLLKCDTSGVWHPAHSQDPFGFEVVASPYLNRSDYAGPDEGRYIFETLSQAYTALSIYEGLARYGSKRTFNHFARQVPGFTARVNEMLNYAYPQD